MAQETLNQTESEARGREASELTGLVSPLSCPFCGKPVDLEDPDTLYPSGTGWKFNEELQMRTYHRHTDVPKEQWCYTMHCPVQAGGCGAEMHGDTEVDALAQWNRRANSHI